MKAALIIWIIAINGWSSDGSSPTIQMKTINFESIELCRKEQEGLKAISKYDHKNLDLPRSIYIIIQARCVQTSK